jgi:hypothetical protein
MHIVFKNCAGLFGNAFSAILPQASADTDLQVTVENSGALLLDKLINLALVLSKFQILKFYRLWREFNELLAIEGTFFVSSEKNGGATRETQDSACIIILRLTIWLARGGLQEWLEPISRSNAG